MDKQPTVAAGASKQQEKSMHTLAALHTIDPLQNRGQKIEFFQACWYGNRKFLNDANCPSNHYI